MNPVQKQQINNRSQSLMLKKIVLLHWWRHRQLLILLHSVTSLTILMFMIFTLPTTTRHSYKIRTTSISMISGWCYWKRFIIRIILICNQTNLCPSLFPSYATCLDLHESRSKLKIPFIMTSLILNKTIVSRFA